MARRLADALRSRGLKVWFDEWELVPGRPWQEALEQIIKSTTSAAVLVGEDGVGPWEDVEMRACISEFVRRKLPVIPVLLPGARKTPDLPFFMQQFTWVDLKHGLTDEELDRIEWGIRGIRRGQVVTNRSFEEPHRRIRFLWIPGGWFEMGDVNFKEKQPLHWERVAPFWIAETPVTNRQYATFIESAKYPEPQFWRHPRFSAPDQPVVGMSPKEIKAFCEWLSRRAKRPIGVPTEAQWEFAARGEDGREYPWGNELPDATRACFDLPFDTGQPAPVGSFPLGRGPYGTADQAGNVLEWCADSWDAVYKTIGRTDRQNWGVVRGGSWFDSYIALRSAFRVTYAVICEPVALGFRLATLPLSDEIE